MPDPTPKLYEGLFLMRQSAISAGLDSATDTIAGMLDRAEAEVLALRKWEERKLAYPIASQKRGTFLLALFKVNPVRIANIERDCNLSEDVLRVLMTRGEHLGETEIAAAVQGAEQNADEAQLTDDAQNSEGAESGEGGEGDQAAQRQEPAESNA